jgi:catechol 2,3-dioxygenase-like lactoylglutathione lyase family enzyme
MRLQLAINVRNLESAIDFYTRAFGVKLNKRKPGYANLVLDEPAVKLVLFENPQAVNQLNHVGFEVFDDAEVGSAAARLEAAGLVTELQTGDTCCYATQNKVIAHDPDGIMWEWYRVVEDAETFAGQPVARGCACCA